MGNCYGGSAEYTNDEIKKHLRSSKIHSEKPIRPDEEDLSQEETQDQIERALRKILDVIPESHIQSMISNLNQVMSDFEMTKKNTILNKVLKTLDTPFEMYFKQENYKASETAKKQRIHNMLYRIRTIFTPAASMLYELNTSEELMRRLDGNMKDYRTVRFERSADSNTIVQVSHVTTKKFLIIKSKSFLTMRVYRRISDDEFIAVGESVLRNQLADEPDMKEIRDEAQEECEILLSGTKYGGIEEDFTCYNFTRGDFRTTTGNMILKPIFKKTFNTYHNKNLVEFMNFILEDHNPADLVWFDQDPKAVSEILAEQRQIMLDMLQEVPEIFPSEIKEKLEKIRPKGKSGDVDGNEEENDRIEMLEAPKESVRLDLEDIKQEMKETLMNDTSTKDFEGSSNA